MFARAYFTYFITFFIAWWFAFYNLILVIHTCIEVHYCKVISKFLFEVVDLWFFSRLLLWYFIDYSCLTNIFIANLADENLTQLVSKCNRSSYFPKITLASYSSSPILDFMSFRVISALSILIGKSIWPMQTWQLFNFNHGWLICELECLCWDSLQIPYVIVDMIFSNPSCLIDRSIDAEWELIFHSTQQNLSILPHWSIWCKYFPPQGIHSLTSIPGWKDDCFGCFICHCCWSLDLIQLWMDATLLLPPKSLLYNFLAPSIFK